MISILRQHRSFKIRRKYSCSDFTSEAAVVLAALATGTYSIAVSAQEAPPLPDFKPMESISIPKTRDSSALAVPRINPSISTNTIKQNVPLVPVVPTQINHGPKPPVRSNPSHSNTLHRPSPPNVKKSPKSQTPRFEEQNLSEIDYSAFQDDVFRRIKQNWFPPKGNGSHRVTSVFTVHQDGRISDVKLTKPSSNSAVNEAALQAIQNASPLCPLPKGAPISVPFEYRFDIWDLTDRNHNKFRNF